jgi:hypothetical protein
MLPNTEKTTMNIEKEIALNIVRSALAKRWSVSVHDDISHEGEWTVKKSRHMPQILEALGTTEGDILLFHNDEGKQIGMIILIWGNDEDLIHDHSSSLNIREDGWINGIEGKDH